MKDFARVVPLAAPLVEDLAKDSVENLSVGLAGFDEGSVEDQVPQNSVVAIVV